ncbi:MAG: hypothetical protein KKB20_07430 [Proteobacteria bacterium]|nr:hypothetical protein [Pseudomonadota bacterium]
MSQIKAGIYLEVKKGTIGTGGTAQTQEYRNFWMTVEERDGQVNCALLDNDFNLTPLRESFSTAEFDSGRFTFIPQGEKRYKRLLQKLGLLNHPKPAASGPKTAAGPPQKKPSANWWEGQEKKVEPGDIFKSEPDRPAEKPAKTGGGNWWDGSEKKIDPGDIFKRDEPKRPAQSAKARKKSETVLKKSWWET